MMRIRLSVFRWMRNEPEEAAGLSGRLCEQYEACWASDKAPHLPVAGTSLVSSLNENVQVELLLLDDVLPLHAMGPYSKYSHQVRVRSRNPLEVWGAFAASRLSALGGNRSIQMDAGGE